MADLLIMSTLDQKMPAEAPGSGDLLDTLVQDHLERTERPEHANRSIESTPPEYTPGPSQEPEPIAPDADMQFHEHDIAESTRHAPPLSNDERVKLLQREIELLLKDTAAAAPEIALPPVEASPKNFPGPMPADTAEARVEALKPLAEMALPGAAPAAAIVTGADPGSISQAELDTLVSEVVESSPAFPVATAPPALPEVLPAVSATGIPEAEISLAPDDDEDAARKLTEAEGVLAEELAQLMAESTSGPPAGDPDERLADPLLPADLSDAPAAVATTMPAEAVPPHAPPSIEATAAPTTPAAAAPAGEVAAEAITPPPGVPEHPTIELALPDIEFRRKGIVGSMNRLASGIMLLIAQVFDMPFAWISELDKNILGFAAFILLLSGIALYLLASIYK